ncbi:DUF3618 domain-containing protein [Elioraea sp.]|uniref:DUF3618 domain-containing protein n=1 Tax=Elioraea sp. TaxID=2185103 RepID=UPI0025C5644D|nr:DUF3618 domain-containing protein [Elioraea sp.]
MSATTTHPGSKSADQIEHEVEQTRASVSGTVDALRVKLQPGQIVDDVVDRISDYAKGSGGADFARNLGASVRDNPLPVLLIGAGIGWLLLSKHASGAPSSQGSAGHPVQGHAEAPGAGASPSEEPGGGRRAMERTSALARRAVSRWDEVSEAQPLLIGVFGLALGAALAAVLPGTRTEDRLMGEARDAVIGRVTDSATATYDEVRAVVGEEAEQAAQKISETYTRTKEQFDRERTGDTLIRAADDVGETLGAVASAAASRINPGKDVPSGTETSVRPPPTS